ncbi:unnamed protein product [Callosobruchus maculatus]|uniref:Telomere-associated protein Rif1 N-terminal domain-containing protein n=1 Tax=Callosobruchus maculatus TaxID=64391 RepID=A0A653DQV3_CALMS|nr:unnamed protein product [Callosobruchus maculatus]
MFVGYCFYLAAVTDNSDCFDYISQILESIVQKSNDDAYFQKILMLIPSAFVTESKISIKLMEKLMKPMWKVLFNAENIPPSISETFKHCITKVFANTTTVEEKIKIVKDVMREIVTVQITDKNVQTVNKIWFCLAKEITDEFGVEKLEQFDDFNNFFLWPAYFIHNLEETDKKQTVLLWMKLYRKLAQESDDKKIEIFKDLEKIFKNNPLLATNITSLVNIMSQFDSKRSNDFVCRLLGLVSQVLELPNLKNDDEHKLTNLMLQYLDPTLECYSEQSEHHDVISKMCNCIKHTLCLHQSYKVLEPLGNFLRTSPQNVRIQFSKHLNELLADLYKKQSDAKSYAAKELQKVMVIFEEGDEKGRKVFVVPSGRSARIANLAKKSPKSPKKASPVSLKLFGKDLDTLSPLKVKGSQLNNTTPTRKKKAANVIPSRIRTPSSLDDESASKFVAIDSEVKFQPSKLSEHQKEVLKRRRDDIPALYQDLSQSQSQDFCSKSNSNEVSQDQQEVKERRLSRDVAEVIEELNEFVQVRTSFEEEEKDGEEVKQAQNSQDLFGESEAVMQVQKPTEDQPKPMLSESLFSEEITQESAGKSSEIITPNQDDTGNKTTSDMTSLKVEETLSKPSEMSSLEVAETTSKSSGMTSKNLEQTSNKTSENTSPKIEVSSSKSSSTTSKIDEETSNKTSENTSQKIEVSSSKSSSTTSKIDEETSNKTSGNTLQKIEVSSSKSSGVTSKNDEEISNKTSENTSPNIEVSSDKSSGMTSKNDEETSNKTSENTSLNVEVSSSKTSDMMSKNDEETSNKTSENTSLNVEVSSSKTSGITSLEVGKTANETSEMTSVNEDGDEVKLKEETKEEKKKRKIAAELAKLQMNIVGADEYFASSRRRRAKPKDKDKEEELGKKPGRKSLGAQLDEKTAGNARRKTMESSSSENDTPKRISRKPDQNVTAVKKPKIPPKQTANADVQVVTDSNENVPTPKKDLEQASGSEVEDVSASVACEPKTPKYSKKGSNQNVSASKKDLEPASVSEVEDVSASVRCEPKTPKKGSTENVSAPKKDLEQAEIEDVSVRCEPKSPKPPKKRSNENVSAPTKDLEQAIVSEVDDVIASVRSEPRSPKSSKKRSKNLNVEATVDVSKQQTVPSITDQKNTKTPRKRSKVRDSEVSEVPEQPTTVPLEQKVGKSPKKEGKAKSPLSKVAEQKSSKSPRKGSRRQHSEPSNTPEPQKVEEKETLLSGQKANDSVRKMTHKRDLSRQLVNIGPQNEPATSIVQKDLKRSPKKIVISNISEQGIVATNSGQDAVDSPKKRVRRIVSEHSYVVKNIEAENIISAFTDSAKEKTQQSTPGIEAKSVASTSPGCGPEGIVNLQEGQESTVVGNLPESENQILEEQSSKEHITPEEEHKQVISDSIGPDFETKIKRKKKHSGGHVTAESEQVIGFDHGEIKVSKKKHKKKHSDHDSSEDGGEHLSGLKSPKKKSKKKHSETPEKIEAVKAAELRFKKRLSDLESEIDHCRQFISQTEAKEDNLVIVDNNEMVSPSSENEDNRAIKIRLKRREDSGKKRRSKKDKYEVAQTQEEVGETRKRKLSTEEDCEDVIESSQESYADISSLTNASTRRKLVMTVDTIDEETMVQKGK